MDWVSVGLELIVQVREEFGGFEVGLFFVDEAGPSSVASEKSKQIKVCW